MADDELTASVVTDGDLLVPVATDDWLVSRVADGELIIVESTLIAFRVGLGTPSGFILP